MIRKENIIGLTKEEVDKQFRQHGANILPAPKVDSFWEKFP